jgi:hypothetical protein
VDDRDFARAQAVASSVAPVLAASRAASASVARMVASTQIMSKAFARQVTAVQAVAQAMAPVRRHFQTIAGGMASLVKHLRVIAKAGERMAHYLARAVAPHLLKGIGLLRHQLWSLISHLEHGPPTGVRRFAGAFLYWCDGLLERVQERVQARYSLARANFSRSRRIRPAQVAKAEASRRRRAPVRPLAASITRHAPPRPFAEGRSLAA